VGFERVGFIRPVPLPGGDAAAREPWRMALAHILEAGLPSDRVTRPGRTVVEAMIREGVNTVPTSSAGRLFDALASLLGLRDVNTYEGQAAVELEAASSAEGVEPYPLPVEDEPTVLDPRPLVRAVVEDVDRGVPTSVAGARIHETLAAGIAEACARVRRRTGLGTVALSGGCFQNRLLTLRASDRLRAAGFEVLLHARVPPNDGGIALGQAAVAAWRLARAGTRA
jgi:hydrogenase maturation protein HypF